MAWTNVTESERKRNTALNSLLLKCTQHVEY